MPETSDSRSVIASPGWGLWIVGAIGIALIFGVIYGAWRLWKGATAAVTREVEPVVETTRQEPTVRFVRTPTEIIVIDDPIIPEGETALEDIFDDPANFLGKSVVVSGTVTEFESAAFFQVHQDEDQITIMALPEAIETNQLESETAPQDQPVRVMGTVKRLTREIEKKGFGLEIKNLDEAFWQDQIVIEAVTITKINGSTT